MELAVGDSPNEEQQFARYRARFWNPPASRL